MASTREPHSQGGEGDLKLKPDQKKAPVGRFPGGTQHSSSRPKGHEVPVHRRAPPYLFNETDVQSPGCESRGLRAYRSRPGFAVAQFRSLSRNVCYAGDKEGQPDTPASAAVIRASQRPAASDLALAFRRRGKRVLRHFRQLPHWIHRMNSGFFYTAKPEKRIRFGHLPVSAEGGPVR